MSEAQQLDYEQEVIRAEIHADWNRRLDSFLHDGLLDAVDLELLKYSEPPAHFTVREIRS